MDIAAVLYHPKFYNMLSTISETGKSSNIRTFIQMESDDPDFGEVYIADM